MTRTNIIVSFSGSRLGDVVLTAYVKAAMYAARFEVLEDEGSYFSHIPGSQGGWANATTLDACRTELQEVLEDWILIGVRLHHTLPVV